MRSLPELIAGNGGNQLLARLTYMDPLPRPISLALLEEAAFPGYSPAIVLYNLRQLGFEGMAELSGQAQFNNFGPALGQPPTALYLTTLTLPTLLVAVAIIDRKVLASTPQGVFYANFSVMGYELP